MCGSEVKYLLAFICKFVIVTLFKNQVIHLFRASACQLTFFFNKMINKSLTLDNFSVVVCYEDKIFFGRLFLEERK